jgi:hypothetical protein
VKCGDLIHEVVNDDLSTSLPEVRYKNREAPVKPTGYSFVTLRRIDLAGYYYLVVGRSKQRGGNDSGAPLPIRLRVAVTGDVAGVPTYANGATGAVSGDQATSSQTSSSKTGSTGTGATDNGSRSSGWPLWEMVVGVLLVAVGGTVGFMVWRRRGLAAAHDGGGSQT